MEQIKTIKINDNLIDKHTKKEFWENFLSFAIFLGVFLLMFCFFQRTKVVGHSMDSTLFDGQQLWIARTDYNNTVEIDNGDIVVVDSEFFKGFIVKRVIGTPGDTIEIKDNVVYINDVALEEDYINEQMITDDIPKITLADDEYFIMGDNRNHSSDSRMIGPVKKDEMYGKVVFDFYNFTTIAVPEVFDDFRN
jgi:signal peptidase I